MLQQSATDAVALADRLRIHPAIVAGRVRHETENWRLLNGLLCDEVKSASTLKINSEADAAFRVKRSDHDT